MEISHGESTQSINTPNNKRMSDLHFKVGYTIFLKVTPIKGLLRFEKKSEDRPVFKRLFKNLENIGDVSTDWLYHMSYRQYTTSFAFVC